MKTAVLNITYNGVSNDTAVVESSTTDDDIRRITVELVRDGTFDGTHIPNLSERMFDNYVVDRYDSAKGGRIYLRPKVPFGGD